MDRLVSVANTGLTKTLSPLDATLIRNWGVGVLCLTRPPTKGVFPERPPGAEGSPPAPRKTPAFQVLRFAERLRSPAGNDLSLRSSFRHAHIFVGAAVVKEPAIALSRHPLNKYNVRHLANLLPFFFRGEDGLIGSRDEFSRIVAVKHRDASAIDEIVVRAVVDEYDAARRKDRRRARLDHARIKFSRSARQHRRGSRFGPVDEIGGVRESHLVGLVGGGAKPVHPVFAADFFRDDSARFGPPGVPISLVRRKDHALALPVEQVAGSGEAKLRVLLVVAGVRGVEGAAEFLQPPALAAPLLFALGFRREHRLGAARGGNAVAALGLAQAR